jgi:LCP family protein required for cell wall assembly
MGRTQNLIARSTSSNLFILAALIFFIAVVVGTGMLTYNGVRNFVVTGSLLPPQAPVLVDNGQGTPELLETPVMTATVEDPVGPIARPWDGASRVTVLLMGLDFRDWQKGEGAPRTDTMILLTIDPLTRTAGILNIPRDLWVSIPGGFGYGKINTAYRLGAGNNYPGGGPGLAIETVEEFLGIPINYYAQIDFYTFEKFIDEIGGVDIDVPNKIRIDPIGKMNTVILQAGTHHLDGPKALAYARARYTEGGDFDRGVRQQQVIFAIRDRVLSLDMLTSLIGRAPALYEEYITGIKTNLALDEAISLAWLAKDIHREQIKQGVISPPDQVLLFSIRVGGESQDVLKPITSKIRMLRDEIFASSLPSPLMASADPAGLMQAEGARLSILNGSGTAGMANRTADYLKTLGANVASTGDAAEFAYETALIDYTGNPYTLQYLVTLMNIQPNRIRFEYNPASQVDVAISLGADWANKNEMP